MQQATLYRNAATFGGHTYAIGGPMSPDTEGEPGILIGGTPGWAIVRLKQSGNIRIEEWSVVVGENSNVVPADEINPNTIENDLLPLADAFFHASWLAQCEKGEVVTGAARELCRVTEVEMLEQCGKLWPRTSRLQYVAGEADPDADRGVQRITTRTRCSWGDRCDVVLSVGDPVLAWDQHGSQRVAQVVSMRPEGCLVLWDDDGPDDIKGTLAFVEWHNVSFHPEESDLVDDHVQRKGGRLPAREGMGVVYIADADDAVRGTVVAATPRACVIQPGCGGDWIAAEWGDVAIPADAPDRNEADGEQAQAAQGIGVGSRVLACYAGEQVAGDVVEAGKYGVMIRPHEADRLGDYTGDGSDSVPGVFFAHWRDVKWQLHPLAEDGQIGGAA